MPRKPRITVTGDRKEVFVRRNGVLVAHATKKLGGRWECFRVHGGNGPAPTATYVDTIRGQQQATDLLTGLVA